MVLVPTTLAGCPKEATTMFVLDCTVLASDASDAHAKVAARLPQGFLTTGVVTTKSERHALYTVQVSAPADLSKSERNAAWVQLTSYGITPSDDLKAGWQRVAGVGC